ncbi:MAG: hypothetical protein PHR06_01820 [Candidatus Cloacimonetes bacterium]|nr:hypothetical protein [Candidatus Cloacimonadota bacterium]
MSGRFIGTINEKPITDGRLMLPKEYRDVFSEEADQSIIITIGPTNNVVIYPQDNWEKIYKKLAKGTVQQRKSLGDMRLYAMAPQKLEGPGRFRISNELKELTNLKQKVSFVGEGSYISV